MHPVNLIGGVFLSVVADAVMVMLVGVALVGLVRVVVTMGRG